MSRNPRHTATNAHGVCVECGYDFFGATDSLPELRLPGDLVRIEAMAFEDDGIQRVTLNDHCAAIESRAFAHCDRLVRVDIPASVTDIAEDAFEGCACVIVAPENSEAIAFAIEAGIPYLALDGEEKTLEEEERYFEALNPQTKSRRPNDTQA